MAAKDQWRVASKLGNENATDEKQGKKKCDAKMTAEGCCRYK